MSAFKQRGPSFRSASSRSISVGKVLEIPIWPKKFDVRFFFLSGYKVCTEKKNCARSGLFSLRFGINYCRFHVAISHSSEFCATYLEKFSGNLIVIRITGLIPQ